MLVSSESPLVNGIVTVLPRSARKVGPRILFRYPKTDPVLPAITDPVMPWAFRGIPVDALSSSGSGVVKAPGEIAGATAFISLMSMQPDNRISAVASPATPKPMVFKNSILFIQD